MSSCNIGPKNRLARGLSGILLNTLTIIFAASLPPWLFWILILASYIIISQGILGICYFYALLGKKDMN